MLSLLSEELGGEGKSRVHKVFRHHRRPRDLSQLEFPFTEKPSESESMDHLKPAHRVPERLSFLLTVCILQILEQGIILDP